MADKITERDEEILRRVPEVPEVAQPKCPKCQHAPLQFGCNVVPTGMGHVVAIVWCGICGHTLSTQFVGMAEQQAGPRIVRPS